MIIASFIRQVDFGHVTPQDGGAFGWKHLVRLLRIPDDPQLILCFRIDGIDISTIGLEDLRTRIVSPFRPFLCAE